MATKPTLSSHRPAFQEALLRWYKASRRRLPWREKPSLYSTVVSELMLQQTQVKTMLPYFERWLEELPDFESLAKAEEARVLRLWEGLGYYSRARNLHRLAKALVSRESPPATRDEWTELPGIGPYTSAAISSIAQNYPAACVDGNVVRILARMTGDERVFTDSASAAKAFTALAEEVLNREEPGDHNQAMMELGATLCTRSSPRCQACPVSTWCEARRLNKAEQMPRFLPKKTEQLVVQRLWCLRRGELLLHRGKPGARRLAEMLELPNAEQLGLKDTEAAALPLLARKKRSITRFQITEEIRLFATPPRHLPENLVFLPVGELEKHTLSGPHRRWINHLLASGGQAANA